MKAHDLFEQAKKLPGYSSSALLAGGPDYAAARLMGIRLLLDVDRRLNNDDLARAQDASLELVAIGLQMLDWLAPQRDRQIGIEAVYHGWQKADRRPTRALAGVCDLALQDLDELKTKSESWKRTGYSGTERTLITNHCISILHRFVELAGKLKVDPDRFPVWVQERSAARLAA